MKTGYSSLAASSERIIAAAGGFAKATSALKPKPTSQIPTDLLRRHALLRDKVERYKPRDFEASLQAPKESNFLSKLWQRIFSSSNKASETRYHEKMPERQNSQSIMLDLFAEFMSTGASSLYSSLTSSTSSVGSVDPNDPSWVTEENDPFVQNRKIHP